MFFKRMPGKLLTMNLALAMLTIATLTSGCGLEVGEETPEKKEYDVGESEFTCLTEVDKKVDRYFEAKASKKETSEFMDCAVGALQAFETYTEGSSAEGYKPKEIQEFLQHYFIKDRPISDNLVHHTMHLKRILVGGRLDFITRDEFRKLIGTAEFMKGLVLQLHPHVPIYNVSLGRKRPNSGHGAVTEGELNAAERAAVEVGRKLGERLEETGEAYELENLADFIAELRLFVNWHKHNSKTQPAKEITSFIQAFKSTAVSAPGKTVNGYEWARFGEAAASWYTVWLRYSYKIDERQILSGEGLDSFLLLAGRVFGLIEKSVDSQSEKVIAEGEVKQLVDAAAGMDYIPFGLTAKSVNSLLPVLFSKVFWAEKGQRHGNEKTACPATDRRSEGVNCTVVKQLEGEFNQWSGVQRYLDQIVRQEEAIRRSGKRGFFGVGPEDTTIMNISRQLADLPWTDLHRKEIERITGKIKPLYKSGDSRAHIMGPSLKQDMGITNSYFHLSKLNVIRTGARLAIRGFSDEPLHSEMMLGLTEDELKELVKTMRLVFFDLEMMKQGVDNPASRIFLEGNMFTNIGDGVYNLSSEVEKEEVGNLLSYEEGIELIAFLTTGLSINRQVHSSVAAECRVKSSGKFAERETRVDEFGREILPIFCFRLFFKPQLLSRIDNLWGMKTYLKNQRPSDWRLMNHRLLKAAVGEKCVKGLKEISYTAMGKVTMMIHYIESIMTRYDANENGILEEKEAMSAFPVFRGLLAKMAAKANKNLSERQLKALFGYILKHRKTPPSSDTATDFWSKKTVDDYWNGVTTWLNFVWGSWFNYGIELDRGGLTEVFTAIIHSTGKDKSSNECDI